MTDQPPHDGEGKHMEASVEARLQFLEERVKTLEAIVSAGPAPARAAPPKPVEPAATVAAALAALYASDTAATAVYHLVSSPVGLVLAGLIGAAAMLIAIRWDSPVVAGIGLVGGLLSPVLVDAGTTAASLAFMTVALVATVGVLIWRRWSWLASIAYVVSAPQAASWVDSERHTHLGLALAVTAAFWALFVVA